MAKKRVKKSKPTKQDDSKLFAFLAILLSVVGFIIALLAKRKDKYVMFYAKESLILFITGIVAKVLTVLLMITIVGVLAVPIVWVAYFVIWVIALINSLSGKQRPTPLVGKYAKSIKL
ncbi:MAG TPA: DUF4870 domain-containing protein [Candidatus Pacearchaeota archaeon]|nr:chloroplast import component protein [archaeon BMS3Abin17]HDK42246.1 DUF4870 domain-containing protein [Candidatus Pacearchaeota archaeon]HDZ60710.1 DUF4870 domain-containing protein [Candidatus Pacearchaeota archaeon]